MTEIGQPNRVVSFTRMDESTKEDIDLIFTESKKFLNDRLVDTMIDLLDSLKGPTLGYQVDRYEHSLQTASRALREGARTDLVVAALLHDVGDAMAPANHAELAASIVRPYLDAESTWVVQHHGIFQGYHYWDRLGLDTNAREKFRGSPYFDTCAHFCAEWDQVSFDPAYPTLPIDHFVPMLREVFARPASGFGTD
ncbi:HD domain-containing protein [Rhodococcus sp. Q1]|uniref:HD domain-containing protein n=1 Tax=unclassified Rhodococcus (in: high G+C Gram-positive bacteria) TaxID=192944 RepID=UPI001F5CB3AE|nr:HD domain-containing protein [Rhodococcus sp. Q1]